MPPRTTTRAIARRWYLLALVAVAWAAPSHAYTVPDLYAAAVPLTHSGGRADDAAFSAALQIVLVKVTGLDEAPSRLRSAVANARVYVQRYGIGADGRLEVGFDPAAIDRLLTDAGLPIWGRERPVTLMLALVAAGEGPPEWLSAASADPARDLIDAAADMRGVPLIWPLLDAQDRSTLQVFARRAPEAGELEAMKARYRSDAVLFARLTSNVDGELSGTWALSLDEALDMRSGGPQAGMALAAERFANAYATTATDMTTIEVEVSGIVDLAAYARTLEYLERLSVTEQVMVDELAGESLRLRLALRGDPATFVRSVALDDQLAPVETQSQPGRLSYRFQP